QDQRMGANEFKCQRNAIVHLIYPIPRELPIESSLPISWLKAI
ncbi:hypothetical protein PRIPAC_71875, partial [Pristionchus pacificus]